MGAWGTSFYSDDFACDVRDDYVDKLKCGKTNEEATRELIDENQDIYENAKEEAIFWLALADTQWNYGRLLPEVKNRAMLFLDADVLSKRWPEFSQNSETVSFIHELTKKLNSKQPALKKIKKQRLYKCKWQLGDVFAYRFSSGYSNEKGLFGKYTVFRKVSEDTWWPGHIVPVVQVYNFVSDTIPSLDDMIGIDILPASYNFSALSKCARRDIDCKVKLLSESDKEIPKSNLIFLGNVQGEDLIPFQGHDYWSGYLIVGWESSKYNIKFEHYVIDTYLTWHKVKNNFWG